MVITNLSRHKSTTINEPRQCQDYLAILGVTPTAFETAGPGGVEGGRSVGPPPDVFTY